MSKLKKQFDFTKFKQRHIALKILYFGWDYNGLAAQEDSETTIEFHLFQALTKTCLIESRAKCNYNRCGRTDKGVSSYGQVVNLNIRSNLLDEKDPLNIGLFSPDDYSGDTNYTTGDVSKQKQELNYVEVLNRVLPDHIKTIAWAPVVRDFSSRFSCQSRSYSYIFPLGDLCLESMRKTITHLVGEHDFRNLCSFDLKNGVTNHKRTILSAHIQPLSSIDNADDNKVNLNSRYSFYEVIIVGQAFLYHQIRCIMTIIFLVGTRKESPEIMRDLLDIETCSSRPNYNKASPMPLCLFDCKYKLSDLPLGWNYDLGAIVNLLRQLKSLWLKYKTKTLMIERVLTDLDGLVVMEDQTSSGDPIFKRAKLDLARWRDFGLECDNMSDTKYIPLLKRPRDQTLESKLEAIRCKEKSLATPSSG